MTLHPALSLLLLPPSWVFKVIVYLRDLLYRLRLIVGYPSRGIVISVGNITMGGTGKTPLVVYIAEGMLERQVKVGILSRGYRNLNRAQTDMLLRTKPTARDVTVLLSDETWMMERHFGSKVPLGVGADRSFHMIALEKEGVEWFLLDDGFQHRQLARDVDIVLLDSTNPFGNGRLLPAGPLREPISALSRADIIVITRTEYAPALEAVVRRHSSASIFYATPDLKDVEPTGLSRISAEPNAWLGKRMFVFCGIGNPSAFVGDIRRWGMEVAGHMAFRDHHAFEKRDIERIETEAQACGAQALICTDKDIFHLLELRFQHFPLYVCRIAFRLPRAEEFWRTLEETAQRNRAGRAL